MSANSNVKPASGIAPNSTSDISASSLYDPKLSQEENFGEHLLIDGYGGCSISLSSADVIRDLIFKLVDGLDMKTLAGPIVCEAQSAGLKDGGGITAFVVVQESHISIHTFPLKGFVSADVYSCRNGLRQDLVQQLLSETFQLSEIHANLIERGLNYATCGQ